MWPWRAGEAMLWAAGESSAAVPARPRLLIVDDDWLIRLQIEHFLTAAGFEIVGAAADAATAVALAGRERPDLVLMDIRLSGPVDGIAAAQEIADRFGIRSLFVSAHTDPGTLARTRRAQPLGWVPKPFTEAELLQGVKAALAAR
ncbi:response regulator [Benzoatithermus flavus]|uniref:Response regulator n=1 Tax=Benzoatithermus flavus TaxID=3108223 RepID=A0ABU8XUJ2_9PROT